MYKFSWYTCIFYWKHLVFGILKKKMYLKFFKKKKKQSISKGKEEKKENGIVEGTSKCPKVQSNV